MTAVSPGLTTSAARWIVRNGARSVPALVSLPPGDTYHVRPVAVAGAATAVSPNSRTPISAIIVLARGRAWRVRDAGGRFDAIDQLHRLGAGQPAQPRDEARLRRHRGGGPEIEELAVDRQTSPAHLSQYFGKLAEPETPLRLVQGGNQVNRRRP